MTPASLEEATGQRVFGRVLAGIDGSEASRSAAVQAGRLVAPGGTLELVTAIYLIDANLQHWSKEQIEATLDREGGPWLADAAARVGSHATTRLLNGPAKQALLDQAIHSEATLIVVGTHEHSRLSEILIGGVTGPLLHEAPCAVLIARPAISELLFPLNIVVGVDGSPGSIAALAAGQYLSARFGVPLRAVLARRGEVDIVHAELRAPQLEIVDDNAVDALVDAGASSDLVIVGSRGLHGLGALGSVSERVAHKARASVLVVR